LSKLTCLYLACIYTDADNFWKVGITKNNPEERIGDMQTGCPLKIHLVGEYILPTATARAKEKEILKALSEFKTKGEWFKYSSDARKIISPIMRELSELDFETTGTYNTTVARELLLRGPSG
jgi:hypothetical protein